MKITKKRESSDFRDAKPGDVFLYCGEPYLRTHSVETKSGWTATAVCIETSRIVHFGDERVDVEIVDAELVIR